MGNRSQLTPRESQVLDLVVKEYSSMQIAGELQLSVRTVEVHRKNIYRKTNSQNLVGLIKYAIQAGRVEGFRVVQPDYVMSHT